MNWASGEIVSVLTFLLPGFITVAVFYALTSHPRPGAFERVVLALISTLICQTITDVSFSILYGSDYNVTLAGAEERVVLILVAILFGGCLSIVSNTDILHRSLRRLHVTRETSFPSEWYSMFARYGESSYIVLHMQGGKRLYGYAEEWPNEPKSGHFRIAEAEWLDQENERVGSKEVFAMLVPAKEVTIVEFLPIPMLNVNVGG